MSIVYPKFKNGEAVIRKVRVKQNFGKSIIYKGGLDPMRVSLELMLRLDGVGKPLVGRVQEKLVLARHWI